MKKAFLFTPGPTPVPDRVLAALARPVVNHRSQDFKDVVSEVRGQLKNVFQTQNEVLIITGSGTAAMEGAISSLLRKSDRVLIVDAGKFGERFAKISKAFGLETDVIKVKWGEPVSPSEIEARLTDKHGALLIQASETSTGTCHPIPEIASIMKKFPKCLWIVDGITSVGCMDLKIDELGIDVMISGSQKAFMIPPGLAFAAVSSKVVERMKTPSELPCFYLDYRREYKAILENQTAFTPNTSHVVALRESLKMLLEEGLLQVFDRHGRLARSSREALKAMGLELASRSPSVACTAAYLPNGIDGKAFLKKLRQNYAFTVAGGQEQWEGKVIRLSHLGYYSPFDLLSGIAAIGRQLEREGAKVDTVTALKTFMEVYDL